MFSGGPDVQPAQPAQQGGGGIEEMAAQIAGLPDQELLAFLDALDSALEQSDRGIDLEVATVAQQTRKGSRQQQEQPEQPEAAQERPTAPTRGGMKLG